MKHLPPEAPAVNADTDPAECLAALARSYNGQASELRIERCVYQGRPFTSLRVWERGADGQFYPTRKGVTIRDGELARAIAALRASQERADADEFARAERAARAGGSRG